MGRIRQGARNVRRHIEHLIRWPHLLFIKQFERRRIDSIFFFLCVAKFGLLPLLPVDLALISLNIYKAIII
jgi:hypothetical protein